MLARKSLPTRLWMATGKRAYNFVTRRLMNWSDGEGTEDRVARDGAAIRAALTGVGDVAILSYALPARGVGLYVFAETDMDAAALRKLVPEARAELVQGAPRLPRRADGSLREDALALVAANRLDELELMMAGDTALAEILKPIIAGRLNLTDRVLKK